MLPFFVAKLKPKTSPYSSRCLTTLSLPVYPKRAQLVPHEKTKEAGQRHEESDESKRAGILVKHRGQATNNQDPGENLSVPAEEKQDCTENANNAAEIENMSHSSRVFHKVLSPFLFQPPYGHLPVPRHRTEIGVKRINLVQNRPGKRNVAPSP